MACWKELERFVMHQPTPAARLVAALVVSTLKDARKGDPEAIAWLGENGAVIESLGLSAEVLLTGLHSVLEPTFS